jgi:hypothetical protein
MRQELKVAYEPYAEIFTSRDDYKQKKGVEPPPWDRNRPIQEWVDTRSDLKAVVSYPRMIQTSEISGGIIYNEKGHAIIDEGVLARAWAKSPNFLPREPLVDYGPYGKLRIYPPIIELSQGQFITETGFGIVFEDGVGTGIPGLGGSFTEADRQILKSISAKMDKIIAGK